MKDYIKPVIIGVAILVVALTVIERSCPRSDEKYNQLKGEFKAHKEKVAEDKKTLLEEMAQKDEKNLKLNEEIKELKEKIVVIDEQRIKLDKKDKEKAQTIYELKKEREGLSDPYLIIANQDLLLKTWEERFWGEREDKEKVITQRNYWASMYFKEHSKFLNEKSIKKGLEKQLADQEALTKVGEEIDKEGEKRIKILGLKFNLGKVVSNAISFGLGYLLGAAK